LTTGFELALVVAYNAFTQWVSRCGTAAGAAGFSPLDFLVLSLVNRLLRDKRAADICFALKVEDSHTVAYSLRTLTNAGLVASQRNGKEAFFSTTAEGQRFCQRYQTIRHAFLIDAMEVLSGEELDLVEFSQHLRALSGMYEQAARSVTTGSELVSGD
jgi:predicted MarR family transcription regulator